MIEKTVLITNRRGLHARASAKFVTLASGLPAKVEVEKDGSSVVGTSIMGLMMLGAAMGDHVTIRATGDGAEASVSALAELVEAKFGGKIDAPAYHGFSNPLVKQVRALRDKKYRRVEKQFLAEGLRILTEALDVGITPKMLWYAPDSESHPLVQRLIAAVEGARGDVLVTSPDILSKLSGKENPGAVLGVFDEHPTALETLDRSTSDIWIVAERLRDPGNLGTILRTGDAVGAGGLILIDDCTDPFSVEAVRASMGAVFTQKIVQARWEEFLPWFRSGPGQLVGTSLNTDIDYQAPHYARPVFLMVGNEAQGLPPAYEAECDLLVKMPMRGRADSLNAAVATAVMAYEVLNQRRRG